MEKYSHQTHHGYEHKIWLRVRDNFFPIYCSFWLYARNGWRFKYGKLVQYLHTVGSHREHAKPNPVQLALDVLGKEKPWYHHLLFSTADADMSNVGLDGSTSFPGVWVDPEVSFLADIALCLFRSYLAKHGMSILWEDIIGSGRPVAAGELDANTSLTHAQHWPYAFQRAKIWPVWWKCVSSISGSWHLLHLPSITT